MAGNVAPNTVTNGLVLYLDAGNTNSYPGTGTSWRDISGNSNNGTLTNGPTFNSANLGSIVLDGTDDYVNCGNNSSINITGTGLTLSAWVYRTALNSNIDIQYENNPLVPAPGATTYDDIYFQTSSMTTLIDTGSLPSPTSGWLSSMISGSSPFLGKVVLYGFDNDIIQIYNKKTERYVTGGNDIILYEDTYFPLQVGDFIRFGSDVGGSVGLDYSFSQQLYAIKNLTLGSYNDIPSSLEVIPIVTGSFPAAQDKQNFRLFRRIPNETYVVVQNLPQYDGGGLLIPENFNPNFDPYDLARKAGLIQ
jgi:hypothetical protein